jgi:hypothetical protein
MCKSQYRNTKHPGNSSPSKANSTIRDLNYSKVEKISHIEFKKKIVRMTNELKEETHKLLSELQEDMNK